MRAFQKSSMCTWSSTTTEPTLSRTWRDGSRGILDTSFTSHLTTPRGSTWLKRGWHPDEEADQEELIQERKAAHEGDNGVRRRVSEEPAPVRMMDRRRERDPEEDCEATAIAGREASIVTIMLDLLETL